MVLHHSPNQNERYLKLPPDTILSFGEGLDPEGLNPFPNRPNTKQVEFHGHLHFLALATFHEARFLLASFDDEDVGQQKIHFHCFLR